MGIQSPKQMRRFSLPSSTLSETKTKREVKEMEAIKITSHRGRFSENGKPMSQEHPDRNFDISKAENIDPERCSQNYYWRNPDLGIATDGKTRKEFLKDFYDYTFGDMMQKRNDKAIAQRKMQNCLTAEKMMSSKRYCLEGMILYLGNADNYADRETHLKIAEDYVKWHNEKYPQAPIVCFETHCDEMGAIHSTFWNVYIGHDADGDRVFNQTKALEEMGIVNHHKQKDNAKKTFTAEIREGLVEIARSHGLKLDLTPDRKNSGKSLTKYQRDREIAKYERCVALLPDERTIQEYEKKASKKLVGDRVSMPRKDFDSLVMAASMGVKAIAELEKMKKPLSKVEEMQIENAIREELYQKYFDYNEKTNAIIDELRKQNDFFFEFAKSRGIVEDVQKGYAEKQKSIARSPAEIEFDLGILNKSRNFEIDAPEIDDRDDWSPVLSL